MSIARGRLRNVSLCNCAQRHLWMSGAITVQFSKKWHDCQPFPMVCVRDFANNCLKPWHSSTASTWPTWIRNWNQRTFCSPTIPNGPANDKDVPAKSQHPLKLNWLTLAVRLVMTKRNPLMSTLISATPQRPFWDLVGAPPWLFVVSWLHSCWTVHGWTRVCDSWQQFWKLGAKEVKRKTWGAI